MRKGARAFAYATFTALVAVLLGPGAQLTAAKEVSASVAQARKAPVSWTLVYTDGPSYTADMRRLRATSSKELFSDAFDVVAVGSRVAVAERWTGSRTVYHVRSADGGAKGFTLQDIPRQRTAFIPQPNGVFVTETLPNGESVFLSYLSFPSGERIVLDEFSLETDDGYMWVEDGSSAPVGAKSGYIGAHEYVGDGGQRNRVAFVLLEVRNTGRIVQKFRLSNIRTDFGKFITGFCVSKSGRKLAVTYFRGKGFRENLAIINMKTGRVTHLDDGDYSITGSCFTSEAQIVARVNDWPYLIDIGSRIRYRELKIPYGPSGLFAR